MGKEMLITPRYLVPDTNCFVDMLPSIQTLVGRAEFVVAIPLTGTSVEQGGKAKGFWLGLGLGRAFASGLGLGLCFRARG